jgi:hypothetical protein
MLGMTAEPGEGHISLITFRSGTVDANIRIHVDSPTRFVATPRVVLGAALWMQLPFVHHAIEVIPIQDTGKTQDSWPFS